MMPSSKVEVLKGWCTDGPTVTGIHICLYFQCQLQPFSHPAIKTKIPGGLWIQRTPDESRLDGSDKIQKTCKGEVFFLFSSSGNRVLLNDSSVHEIQTSGLESSETTVYKNLTANWWSMEEVNMVGCRAWIWNHQGFVTLGTRRNHRMTQQHQTQLSSRFYCLFLSSVKGDNRLPNQKPSVGDGQNPTRRDAWMDYHNQSEELLQWKGKSVLKGFVVTQIIHKKNKEQLALL